MTLSQDTVCSPGTMAVACSLDQLQDCALIYPISCFLSGWGRSFLHSNKQETFCFLLTKGQVPAGEKGGISAIFFIFFLLKNGQISKGNLRGKHALFGPAPGKSLVHFPCVLEEE